MKETILIGLVNNIAILLAFTMLYENFWLKYEASKRLWTKIITGIVLGAIGIVLMFTPWILIPGIVFDTRSIMLSISGLFFGPIPTILAMLLTVTLRAIMGGDGMWMGIAVIISSGTIGLLWRQFRTSWRQKNKYIELISMGVIVHIVMTGCALLLPSDNILPTIRNIALPLILIYSPGTMLLGILLLRQSENFQNRLANEKLYESERRLSQILKKRINYEKNLNEKNKEIELQNIEYQLINEELRQTNIELMKAKEKAEESDLLKSAFFSNMSHEIRTPMNGILGFADLLKQPELTGEKQQAYISMIEKGGLRMLNIINDLIDISKIESGQSEVLVSECNVNEQIEYIYTIFKPEVERKGMQIFLKSSLPAQEAIIQTDCEKFCAILTNLIKNAIKYSDKGFIEIGYNLKNNFLNFFVKDTGIGIPIDRQKAIFDRFVQADVVDIRSYQGAGLGLSITKAYLEMLGGEIWVESEEGKGSTFYFSIPYNYNTEQEEIMANKNLVSPNVEDNQIKINHFNNNVKKRITL